MKTKVLSRIIIFVFALIVLSCGKVIDYPEANKPIFNEGDSFAFKDLNTETYDTMKVTSIYSGFEDHDEDLIEYITVVYVNPNISEVYQYNTAWPTGSVISFLNIRSAINTHDKAMDSLIIGGKQYINAFKLTPKKEPSRNDELVYLVYDQNYGLLKYKYFEGPEFILDTVISSL